MRFLRTFNTLCLGCGLTAGLSVTPRVLAADVMLSPAVVGTDLGTYDGSVPLTHLVDQSGLDHPFVSGSTAFETYFATPRLMFALNAPASNWQSTFYPESTPGYLDLDLGSSRLISKLAIWNVSLKDVNIRVSETLDGLPAGTIGSSAKLVDHTAFTFSYPVDILTFSTPLTGRYVRIEIKSLYPIAQGVNFYYAVAGEVVASVAPIQANPLTVLLNAAGGVEVTFSGTLQSSTSPDGPFVDVSGNPQGKHIVPKETLDAQRYYRTRN